MSKKNISRDLAEFIVGLDPARLPKRAIDLAVDATIDCIGCAIAGSEEPLAPILRRIVPGSPLGEAVMIGTPDRASPAESALYNGTLSHALDFDDITHPALSHPSAVLMPTIVALSAQAQPSGREAMAAYIIGIEVFGKLGRALNTTHYRTGWHATATFGTLASAAASAKLLRLNQEQTVTALGIAGSAASGLRANFGTMTKPLHCGYAARNGVVAALLAREGFTACDNILEHAFGFANAFNHGSDIDWPALARWGDNLEILSEVGIALKPYPSCGATHPAIEAALLIRERIGRRAGDIGAVRVGVSSMALQPLLTAPPRTPLEGKFHMGFVIAAALLEGTITLDTFTLEKIADKKIEALRDKVQMEVDPRVAESSEFAAVVTVSMNDGSSQEELVPLAIGKPARWLSHEALRTKFVSCASQAFERSAAEQLFARLVAIENESNIQPLLSTLGSDGKKSAAHAAA